jgi:hypothetical protein
MIFTPNTRPRGRPRSEAAEKAVTDAVYAFLQERSVRELTMEGIHMIRDSGQSISGGNVAIVATGRNDGDRLAELSRPKQVSSAC